jgi:hypothetical protein
LEESRVSLERCPACRARLAQEQVCSRCGCDLTLVRRAEKQARQLTVRAVQAWGQGDGEQALALAHAALQLQRNPLANVVMQSLTLPRHQG